MRNKINGLGNYIKNLIWGLSRIDPGNEYILFATSDSFCHLEGLTKKFDIEFVPDNAALRRTWEQTVLPWRLNQRRIDVFHGTAFIAPLVKTCAHVISVHDMTFRLEPKRHLFHSQVYLRAMMPTLIRNSDRIIAVSESAKKDILDFVPIDDQKISVIHHGVQERFAPVKEEERLARIRSKYRLPEDFILYLGVIEPRKNLEGLVEAYIGQNLAERINLVLAGGLGWDYSSLLVKITNCKVKEAIHMPGYIDEADLPALYSAARVFVYPSFYEGFGLPVLEAMACGTPVITSSVSSLPEVAGDAAILVDPNNVNALAATLQRVVTDRELREELSLRGLKRVKHFTWDETARKTLDVYGFAARQAGRFRDTVVPHRIRRSA